MKRAGPVLLILYPLVSSCTQPAPAAINTPMIIAHRGNSAEAPENTIPAIRSARRYQCQMVEVDLSSTKDGQAVIFHDETLARTTDIQEHRGLHLEVGKLTLAQIQQLDAGKWYKPKFAGTRIPTLVEAVREINASGAVALIDNKSGTVEQIEDLEEALGKQGRFTVQSPLLDFLAEVHAHLPDVSLTLLGRGRLTDEIIEEAKAHDVHNLNWRKSDLTKSSLRAAQRAGLRVFVYTVDSAAEVTKFTAWGVNGILTDSPKLATQTMAKITTGVSNRP